MKISIITVSLCLFLYPVSSLAFFGDTCSKVKWKSLGQIKCSRVMEEDNSITFVLEYKDEAREIVKSRGKHTKLIEALCNEGASKVKEITSSETFEFRCLQ